MRVTRRAQKQARGVDGAAGDDDDVARDRSRRAPSRSTTTPVTVRPDASVSSRSTFALRLERHVPCGERRPDAAHVRVGLAVDETGEAVELGAADAGALLRVRLVEVDADGQVEWVVARCARDRRAASGSVARG